MKIKKRDIDKRHSGRSTKMLKEALVIAKRGTSVFIIANMSQFAVLAKMLMKLDGGANITTVINNYTFMLNTITSIKFEPMSSWKAGYFNYAHQAILIDHYAIESDLQLSTAVEQWIKWNELEDIKVSSVRKREKSKLRGSK
jgi:hypothetical protein